MALAGVATIALCLLPLDRPIEGRNHEPRDSHVLSDFGPLVRPIPSLVCEAHPPGLQQVLTTPGSERPAPSLPGTHITRYYCVGDTTGAYCGNTASGARVFAGAAACDPARLGQTVSVGAQAYICADTGGGVRGDHIDIWCYSPERWGWPPDERPCPDYGDGVAVIWRKGERE